MARFLFVVPPLAGHVYPTIAIGRELLARGHIVAWVGCGVRVRALLPQDLALIPVEGRSAVEVNAAWLAKAQSVSGLESFQFFYEDFLVPLAHAMLPGAQRAIDRFQPDVVVCDQQALAGAFAARLRSLPWATLATTSAAVFNPMADFPKVNEWMIETLGKAQDAYGLERWERPDLSSRLVLILSVHALVGEHLPVPKACRFIGPCLRPDAAEVPFPWGKLARGKKRVYLSLGTVNGARSSKFYDKVKAAFAGTDLQLILAAPPELLGEVPANFLVRPVVPQLQLLEHVDAVIFHGGHNTLCETLLNGLPAVVAPIKDDQPVVAEQLVRCGAGVRVHFDRVKSEALYAATRRVLDEPAFTLAARAMQHKLRISGGPRLAADCLTQLTASPYQPLLPATPRLTRTYE